MARWSRCRHLVARTTYLPKMVADAPGWGWRPGRLLKVLEKAARGSGETTNRTGEALRDQFKRR